jgi:predicted Zn-dependent peptidase
MAVHQFMILVNTRRLAILTLVGLVWLYASVVFGLTQRAPQTRQTESWRKHPPKSDAPRTFKLPAAREIKLDNGLTIVLIQDHRSPVVTITVGIPVQASSSRDISELTNEMALTEATAELITEGAGSRSSEEVAREVETLGGRLSSSANDDYAWVDLSVVAENADRMLELLGDVLLRPTYPESEVALYKRNRIQKLVVQRQDPSFIAGEQFDRIVYGSHPYAISAPTPASVDALDREKIMRFYDSQFAPVGSVAVIAGDFDSTRIQMKAREVLGMWKTRPGKSADVPGSEKLPESSATRVVLIDRPGSAQADFRVGGLAVKRSDADYFPLLVANAVLGAGSNSRLFLNIRERRGYAYDVFSSVDALKQVGTFFGAAESRTEVTIAAIREMLAEFDKLRTLKVGEQELQDAKNYLNGLFSLSLSTQGGVAERTLQTYMFELGRDYLEGYRSRIESVTAEQVQQAARKYILTDHATIVVVGDAAKLKRELGSLGRVSEVSSVENKPKS